MLPHVTLPGAVGLTGRKQLKLAQQRLPPQGRQNMKTSHYKTLDVQSLSEMRSEKYPSFSQDKSLCGVLLAHCSPLSIRLPPTPCPSPGACPKSGRDWRRHDGCSHAVNDQVSELSHFCSLEEITSLVLLIADRQLGVIRFFLLNSSM